MVTKTEIKILELFCSSLTERYSIKKVAELLNKPYPLIYHAVQSLLLRRYLLKDEHGLISLNYKENPAVWSYIENGRAQVFLLKHKLISLFLEDLMKKISLKYFTLLVFGSYVKGKQQKQSDLDLLLIVEDSSKINFVEKLVENVAENLALNVDCHAITPDSVKEMLLRRDEKNLINETINNHIILFGAENYYLMLKNDR